VEPVAGVVLVSYQIGGNLIAMSNGRSPVHNLSWFRALLLAGLPVACATGVEPDIQAGIGIAGTSAEGGTDIGGGGSETAGTNSIAGTTSDGGKGAMTSGGTTSTAGKAGSGSGGAAAGSGAGGKGGSGGATGGGGGSAGRGGSGGGSSGGSGGSGGSAGGCGCTKTIPWVDNMSINPPAPPLVTGECVTVMTQTFLYTGAKDQAYLNGDCNPTGQEPWCTGTGNDYKFMACAD
jgi:hypothetical protein